MHKIVVYIFVQKHLFKCKHFATVIRPFTIINATRFIDFLSNQIEIQIKRILQKIVGVFFTKYRNIWKFVLIG